MTPLTFVDTHNMVAYFSKSDASQGFDQIIDFLNAHTIQYALVVNPTIYVSCIKQFWAMAKVKNVNDTIQLCALIDGKKVVVSEDIIRRDLHLDDADGVECLLNEDIFEALACRKFNFSKYIFDNIVRNVDSPSKFWMYPYFLQVVLDNQVDDMSTHNTRYISPALRQKVFAYIKRFGKGFSGVETPLFALMLVQPQPEAEEEEEEVEMPVAPAPPSLTSAHSQPLQDPTPTPYSIPQQDQPSTPHALPPQEQPTKIYESSMSLLITLIDTCATLSKKVAELEQDKHSKTLEIL
nr:hypothetical protein [Tanacetum cinerariifolium]